MRALIATVAVTLIAIAPPPAAQDIKPGIIRGRVTAADTGRPLRRARISLRFANSEARPLVGPGTDSNGRFELKDVPPGTYYVSASRAGFLELQHGQRRPGERGVVVEVKPGRTSERIDIALPRGSVITGRITDENGEPYADIRVFAFVLRYENGRRIPFPIGFASTDDVGDYRISGLAPGSYYVSASSSETWRNEKRETLGYATTYYPGNAPLPQPLTLGVAQERAGVDLTLSVARPARVSGRVLRSSGQPFAAVAVSINQTVRGATYIMSTTSIAPPVRTAADGSFEFPSVPPGEYRVRATDQNEIGSEYVPVTGDVENLVIVTRSGSAITGSVVTNEGTPPSIPGSGVRLYLIQAGDNVTPTVRLPAINNDWTFRLSNVGGPFIFRFQGLPEDWMIDAIRFNDRDVTDVPWDVPSGGRDLATLQFVVTQEVGTIDGTVTTTGGRRTSDATVVAFSEDAAFWTPASRFIRVTRPGTDGRFAIRGLPAGNYLVVARDFVEEGQWEDKEFLESVRFEAVRATLARGGSASVELRTKN